MTPQYRITVIRHYNGSSVCRRVSYAVDNVQSRHPYRTAGHDRHSIVLQVSRHNTLKAAQAQLARLRRRPVRFDRQAMRA